YQPGSHEPLARIDNKDGDAKLPDILTKVYHFHNHINGAPEELTNEAGEIVWQGRYESWGRLALQRVAENFRPDPGHEAVVSPQPLRMQGQYAEVETGLCYNTFRYYDPDIGRFISEDPIGLLGGTNLYAFAPNTDAWVDPWGWVPCGSTAGKLPKLKGKSVSRIEKILAKFSFTRTKVSNSAAKNQTWTHADGSEVRIHPYGNESMKMGNGDLAYKSGANAHVHKQNPSGDQLDDLGNVSSDAKLTHIGVKNPSDYPIVRNRPHGSGR
ncbi:MAG: RHS domain-containing protein, partial [Azoarcus sp.]|nr:RHS domain-containing protein [Azoarcus sp.]